MQVEKFDELLDGWRQGKYTPQELLTHLMKNTKEMAQTINHHERMIALMDQRLTDLEEEMKEMKGEGGKRNE